MIIERLSPYLIALTMVWGYLIACEVTEPACWGITPAGLDVPSPAVSGEKPTAISPTVIASSAPTETVSPLPNVILIFVDALRSDHVSAYGYERDTTPNLDAFIADQGVRFQNATTVAPWTCPAVAATLTGRNPSNLGVSWDTTAESIPQEENTLAEYLQDAGYYTVGFANNYCTQGRLGFDQGFDVYDDYLAYEHTTSNKARAELVNERVGDWLENTWVTEISGTRPLFMFIYYFDPHTWHDPLPPYDTLYDSTYTGTLTPEVFQNGRDVVFGEIVPTARDVEHLIALYDGEITYWDYYFGQMLTQLEDLHVLDNTLIIVTSDHGEMFGEHDQWIHGNSLYEEVLRVPLLIRYTDVISSGLVVTTPVQNMDVMPSILDWVGGDMPDNLQAVSLRPLVEGGTTRLGRDVFSEVDALPSPDSPFWIAPPVAMRSIQRDQWKLIHHVESSDADELYQLNPNSIYETDNLILSEPSLAQELRQAVLDWFDISMHQVYLPGVIK